MTSYCYGGFLSALSLFFPYSVLAGELKINGVPWLQNVSPPGVAVGLPPLPPMKLSYELTWKKTIKAATTEIVIDQVPGDPRMLRATATGRSEGLAGSLYPYRFTSTSLIRTQDLRPVSFDMKQETSGWRSENQILFLDKRVVCLQKSTDKKSAHTKDSEIRFLSEEDLVQGVFSVVLGVRGMPLAQGEEQTTLICPLDRPYLMRSKVLGRETRKFKGRNYKTIKLDIFLARVNDDLTLKQSDKLKGVTVWLFDDAERLPLELQAKVFVGHFSSCLVKKEYLKKP